MIWADCCTEEFLRIEGAVLSRVRLGSEGAGLKQESVKHCCECNVTQNGLHHLFCCMEECPKCGDQLTTCKCVHNYKPGSTTLFPGVDGIAKLE